MGAYLYSLTHGARGIGIAYAIAFFGVLAGLHRGRASWKKYLESPLLAFSAVLLGAVIVWLVNSVLRVPDASVLRLVDRVLIMAAIGYRVGWGNAPDDPRTARAHLRGAIVSVARRIGRQRHTGITLAGIPVSADDETKHFKLIGTTGTGKSTAIREMLSVALARGDRAIIADPDGGYLARFYDEARGDVILNPFDGDAKKWDLFGEIANDYDVEQLARSLIPSSGDPDRTWVEYARTFLAAVTQQVIEAGATNDAELYRLIKGATVDELRVLLAGTAAGPFLEVGNEKMFGSVRSITSSAVGALKYTTRQQAPPFSVRQWVRHGAARGAGGKGGVLFLPYKAGEIAALRSMISAWMRMGIFEAMDCEEGDQRLWFVVDELDALGEIDGLKDALARLRKFGGRCVLGFQSIAQVSGTYGKGAAETIVENCGNTLILRCSASEHGGTSEFASKLIGQREVLHTTSSKTRRPDQWRASVTTSEQLRTEPAIMASEIERLPDLAGYLKLASVPDWLSVNLTPMGAPAPVRRRKPAIVAAPPTPPAVVRASSPPAAARPAAPAAAAPRRKLKTAARQASVPPRASAAESVPPLKLGVPAEPAARADSGAVDTRPGGAELRP